MGVLDSAPVVNRVTVDLEAGLGIDQELTRQHDSLSFLEARNDRRPVVHLGANRDFRDVESALVASDDHDVALAGHDHRFTRHDKLRRARFALEIERDEHSGRQPQVRIVDRDAYGHGARAADRLRAGAP